MKSYKKYFPVIIISISILFICVALWIHVHSERRGLYGTYYWNTDWNGEPWKKNVLDREISNNTRDFQQSRKYSRNHFSIEWNGYIRIPETAEYKLVLDSDDGSWLWLDDKLILNNGGMHGLEREAESLDLTQGLHKIRIRYVQFGGEAALRVFWARKQDFFKFNSASLRGLRDDGIAETVLEQLERLEGENFIRQEELLHAVEKLIGKGQSEKHRDLFLKHIKKIRKELIPKSPLPTGILFPSSSSTTTIMKYLFIWGSIVVYVGIILLLSCRKSSLWLLLALLIIILLGHYGIKCLEFLEYWSNGLELQSYFKITQFFQHKPLWKLLFPLEVSNDRFLWTTTGHVIMSFVALLDPHWGPYIALFFASTLLIVTTFMINWMISRSTIFTVTMTMGMAFGTQLTGLYGNFSIASLYLYLAYIQINMLFLYLLFKEPDKGVRLKILFILSLLVAVLSFEYWIDYGLFLFVSMIYIFWISKKRHEKAPIKKVKFVLITLLLIIIGYMGVRLIYSTGLSPTYRRGHESEMVLSYLIDDWRLLVMAVEDVLSNVFTYIYLAFSNYFPGFLLSSNSLYYFGKGEVIHYQYGYHQPVFVYFHHVFSWYFLAGIVAFLFFYFFYRVVRKSLKEPLLDTYIIYSLICILIAAGFFVHLPIKYRPYFSVPLLTYKCVLSILGVTYLIAFFIVRLERTLKNKAVYLSIVLCIWAFILYGGISRNARLAQLAGEIPPGKRFLYIPDILQSTPFENYKEWQKIKQNSKN